MCRLDDCGFLYLRIAVIFIAIIDMIHDVVLLGVAMWKVVSVSAAYMSVTEEQKTVVVVLVIVDVIFNTVDLFFSLVLLRGIFKESLRYVMAWWWWTALLLVLTAVGGVTAVVMMSKHKMMLGIPITILTFIIVFTVFILMVVRAYARYLKRKKLLPTILAEEEEEELEPV